jgi:hypothetical protein
VFTAEESLRQLEGGKHGVEANESMFASSAAPDSVADVADAIRNMRTLVGAQGT